MRKGLRATWDWWRRDSVPISMLAVVAALGFAAIRIGMVDDALRGRSYFGSDYDYLSSLSELDHLGQLGEIHSDLEAIDTGLYSIRGALSSIASRCSE